MVTRTLRARHPSPALVIAIIALIVALGGTSYAAFNLPKNSVGSRQLRKGAVTSAKIHNGAVSSSKIARNAITSKQLNLAQLGTVPSASNASNSDALGNAPATSFQQKILWARVAPDGTLTAGSGTISSGILATGLYEVIFNRSVTGCAYEATIGSSVVSNNLFNDQGEGDIYTEPRKDNPNGVFVAISNAAGTKAMDNAFHLAVIC